MFRLILIVIVVALILALLMRRREQPPPLLDEVRPLERERVRQELEAGEEIGDRLPPDPGGSDSR